MRGLKRRDKLRLLIKRSAAKELEVLPVKDRKRIVAKMEGLATNPWALGSERLSGKGKNRLRRATMVPRARFKMPAQFLRMPLLVRLGLPERPHLFKA